MKVSADRWRALLTCLHEEAPLSDMSLYVTPGRGCAEEIAQELLDEPGGKDKFLLAGARGCGKSTELRRIAQAIGDRLKVTTIDLDASDVAASSA
jgi:stage III sporulation protein SpoIIIAA